MTACLEQPPLFSSADEEQRALFLSEAETAKRYTAAQVEKLRWKRNLILLAIGNGVPASVVAAEAEVSTRTVEQLVCSHAEKVAEHQKTYARTLLGKSARWLALAQMREGEAEFKDLVVATGITAQRGQELLSTSAMGEETGENVLQMETSGAEVLDKVRALLGRSGAPGPATSADSTDQPSGYHSADHTVIKGDSIAVVVGDAVRGAGVVAAEPDPAGRPAYVEPGGEMIDDRGRGGATSAEALETSMCSEKRGDLAKASGPTDSVSVSNE